MQEWQEEPPVVEWEEREELGNDSSEEWDSVDEAILEEEIPKSVAEAIVEGWIKTEGSFGKTF